MNKRINPTRATRYASEWFAFWLKEQMRINGVTCPELAQAIGLERKAIMRYTNGQASPKLEVLAAIYNYFGKNEIQIPLTKGRNKNG